MQNLTEKIAARTGLNEEKATEALLTISEHVKTEFPLLYSVVDLILGTQGFSAKENKSAGSDFSQNQMMYN